MVGEVSGHSRALPVTQMFQDLPTCTVSVEGVILLNDKDEILQVLSKLAF